MLLGIGTIALLPLLPRSAEPGGGVGLKEPRVKLAESQAELKNTVNLLATTRGEMGKAMKKNQTLNASARGHLATALKAAQKGGAADVATVETIRKSLDAAMKDLEAQDKLGNFEIQDLMSRYNQAERLASSTQKKLADTLNAIAGKI
jgi:hypothetical protein